MLVLALLVARRERMALISWVAYAGYQAPSAFSVAPCSRIQGQLATRRRADSL